MRLRRPLPAVQGDTLHIVGVGDNRIGKLAILTDGREWNFFLPAEHGNYAERSVYKLDIVDLS